MDDLLPLHQIGEAQAKSVGLVGVDDPAAAGAAQEAHEWVMASWGQGTLGQVAEGLSPSSLSVAAAAWAPGRAPGPLLASPHG